jgi:deaminated glutathione amidase
MSGPDKLRLAVIPMTSTDQVEVNVEFILSQLKSVENFKPDLICFPENSLYFNFNPKLDPTHAITLRESFWASLSAWAKAQNCFLHFGGVPFAENGKVSNAAILIDPSGALKVIYRKIHLFDVDVEGRRVRESDSFCAGSEPTVLEIKGWRVGMTICYDLRFAEIFVNYHKQKVDLVLVPSSFLVPTGRSHWHVLLRARAIETQAYVAAPAQVGVHKSLRNPQLAERQTWGESLVVGPWGEILAASSSFDEPVSLKPILWELDKAQIQKVRAQIPMLSHRRL